MAEIRESYFGNAGSERPGILLIVNCIRQGDNDFDFLITVRSNDGQLILQSDKHEWYEYLAGGSMAERWKVFNAEYMTEAESKGIKLSGPMMCWEIEIQEPVACEELAGIKINLNAARILEKGSWPGNGPLGFGMLVNRKELTAFIEKLSVEINNLLAVGA
jgi:hypothetical protein